MIDADKIRQTDVNPTRLQYFDMKGAMMDTETYEAVLNTILFPLVFADNDHIIRYLNRPAEKWYYEKRGFSDLIGKSLFDCHKPASEKQIKELYSRLQQGEDEIFFRIFNGMRLSIIAVRNNDGKLIGYYERFEPDGNTDKKIEAYFS
jgi:DUF438 domain-containing protein